MSMTSPWITSHDVRESVGGDELLRQDGDRRLLDRIDARGAGPRREHAQDAAPRADVEDDVARAHDRLDRPLEGLGADLVPDHRPVYLELRVHRVGRDPDRRPHLTTIGSPTPHSPDGTVAFVDGHLPSFSPSG